MQQKSVYVTPPQSTGWIPNLKILCVVSRKDKTTIQIALTLFTNWKGAATRARKVVWSLLQMRWALMQAYEFDCQKNVINIETYAILTRKH